MGTVPWNGFWKGVMQILLLWVINNRTGLGNSHLISAELGRRKEELEEVRKKWKEVRKVQEPTPAGSALINSHK